MGDSLCYLLKYACQKEDICLKEDRLKLQLLSYSSSPTLHSIIVSLSHFNIKNIDLEIAKNSQALLLWLIHFCFLTILPVVAILFLNVLNLFQPIYFILSISNKVSCLLA